MPLSPLVELDLADLRRAVRTNLRGTFVVDQQAARRLRNGGAIINFSSSLTKLARPGYGAYAATKGGVEALTLILARELRGRNITVNAVAPGPTATALFLDGKPQELIDRIAAEPPLERLGQPEDIAEIVSFLAGRGRWINGQVIYTNGGSARLSHGRTSSTSTRISCRLGTSRRPSGRGTSGRTGCPAGRSGPRGVSSN